MFSKSKYRTICSQAKCKYGSLCSDPPVLCNSGKPQCNKCSEARGVYEDYIGRRIKIWSSHKQTIIVWWDDLEESS